MTRLRTPTSSLLLLCVCAGTLGSGVAFLVKPQLRSPTVLGASPAFDPAVLGYSSQLAGVLSTTSGLPVNPLLLADAGAVGQPSAAAVSPLSNEVNISVFVIGLIPFGWATVEFWRRIAVGASFGTGKDSIVIIGEDGDPSSSRGRQVLGEGALVVAYALFAIAALAVGFSVFSVVTAPPDFGQVVSSQVPPPL